MKKSKEQKTLKHKIPCGSFPGAFLFFTSHHFLYSVAVESIRLLNRKIYVDGPHYAISITASARCS